MRFGMLGSGQVAQALATKLVGLGHEVRMGSRSAGNERAAAWVQSAGGRASEGSFTDAAAFGEILINATSGASSLEALQTAGEENLRGKVLIDVANVITVNPDGARVTGAALDDSLGERIQRAFPEARVVKTLNTVNKAVMVDPASCGHGHLLFLCGNDTPAKQQVRELLWEMGWDDAGILDLGGIEQARGPELYLALWVRMLGLLGDPNFNIKLARSGEVGRGF